MKKVLLIGLILYTLIGCDNETETVDKLYIAEIVGYDLNCSTCILHFPNNSEDVKGFLGLSESDFYNSVNLNQSDFKLGELIQVKARIADNNELIVCKILYPTINYTNIYVSYFLKI